MVTKLSVSTDAEELRERLEEAERAREKLRKSIIEISSENAELHAINQRQADNLHEAAVALSVTAPDGFDMDVYELLSEQHRQLGEKTAEIERLRGVLEDIKASPSWRATAPLRRLKSLLGR